MLRAVRLAAALLLACLGLVVTASAPASAECTCRQGDLDRQVQRADVVFIGTIDAVEAQGDDHTYDITASRAYQGTPERSTQVASAGGRNACGLGELGVGTTYVFLATGTEAPYAADSCGGTSVANPTKVEDSAPAGFARTAAPGAAAVLLGLLGLVVVRRLARR